MYRTGSGCLLMSGTGSGGGGLTIRGGTTNPASTVISYGISTKR